MVVNNVGNYLENVSAGLNNLQDTVSFLVLLFPNKEEKKL